MLNLTTRTAPTTFIIVDEETYAAEQSQPEKSISRMKSLYSCLTNPVSTLKDAIVSKLRNKEYIALVCEVCREPVKRDFYYEISNPKEFIGKILPLANAGMKFVCALNTLAGLAGCLGIPSMNPDTLDGAQDFLDSLGSDSLDDFQVVQVQ